MRLLRRYLKSQRETHFHPVQTESPTCRWADKKCVATYAKLKRIPFSISLSIYTHTHTHARTHTHTRTHARTPFPAHTHTPFPAHTHTHAHARTHARTRTHTHAHARTHAHAHAKIIKSARLHLFDQKYSKKLNNGLIFECSSAITLVFIFKNMLFKNISHFKKYFTF